MHGLLYLSDMDIRSQGSKKVNKSCLFALKCRYTLFISFWEQAGKLLLLEQIITKKVLSVDSTFSELDKSF